MTVLDCGCALSGRRIPIELCALGSRLRSDLLRAIDETIATDGLARPVREIAESLYAGHLTGRATS